MNINNFTTKAPIQKSTFESAQKDLFGIVNKLINNEVLKRFLYYDTKDAFSRPNLSEEQTMSLIHDRIKVIPKIPVDEELKSFIIISFDNYTTNQNNPEFRDNIITFDIVCPLSTWVLNSYGIRPYKIMGEIDGMMNGQKLNGIGRAEFVSANQLLLSEDLAGFTIIYRVINDV